MLLLLVLVWFVLFGCSAGLACLLLLLPYKNPVHESFFCDVTKT